MRTIFKKKQAIERATILYNEKKALIQLSEEEDIQLIIHHWVRILNVKLGWIHDFDKLVAKFVKIFCIDYSAFDDSQFICSGSNDNTVRVWNIETNKQIQSFNGHSSSVFCTKFSPYHYYNHHRNVICSSSHDKTICFWDIKDNKQLQVFNGCTGWVGGIEFSPFNGGRYLCSGSYDKTICLWDVETSKLLYVFKGHEDCVWCVDISPLQSDNNNNTNKSNSIGVIGGNGYTICSGSFDDTICTWDIETAKQLVLFKGHDGWIRSVKYGSNKLRNSDGANTILSGSNDCSVRLWDIRSGQQAQIFKGHSNSVKVVEYSPFVENNSRIGGSSNVICSGSFDNTIRFWDIRSNKNTLHVINGDGFEDCGIFCLKFLLSKKKEMKCNNNSDADVHLCYGSYKGAIRIWG
ncbi:WD-40 repeat protein [Reticulomyxa filosa]|uniref:WD-40 repeat protein n=1 Tax=Reticulomyxa filosa TaxID=46433 RepID=X6MRR1_RETFI|nr:WD-40 repeat protein [Reticulomyxa filosa]|eukprot:ETO16698.1 WD-40 repeat protein [Reticulomyxa filosa]